MNKETLKKELEKLNIKLKETTLNMLDDYYKILVEENTKYNLTRITKEEDVYLKHFYDSLTITKIININNQSVCDLGSGAGFPGLVLGISFPSTKITLIESNGKKCNFLRLVKERLNLNNVEIINARIEEYAKENREVYDIVTARAVAPLKHLLEYGVPLVKEKGYFIAMKAKVENEEENIANKVQELEAQQYQIEQFTKTKVELLENAINSKFEVVKFRLFDTQINGGLVECCDTLVNGVPYSDVNNAHKILAGLDIINTLIKFYKTSAPIFIDNRESINELYNINAQVISLIVTQNEKLRIEVMS